MTRDGSDGLCVHEKLSYETQIITCFAVYHEMVVIQSVLWDCRKSSLNDQYALQGSYACGGSARIGLANRI